MFRDPSGLLFTQDGVPTNLVRGGEPHLPRVGAAGADAAWLPASTRRPALLRRLRMLSTS